MTNLGFWRSDSVPGLTVALPPGRHPVPEENTVRSYAGSAQRLLGRYQLEQELGRGATGIVYRGRDPQSGRAVAIKTVALSRGLEAGELLEVRERFIREAETARRLNHPDLVRILDAGEANDVAYLVMEFLQGTDLAPYTRPGNLLPLPQVMRIIARVAAALHYAHANRVVHRDIKPSNIMFESASDTVKVTDFGIALFPGSSTTDTGRALGTPSYMSSEQLAGKTSEGRSDLFSLGVTFYQLVSGHLPFQGDSLPQLVIRMANEPHLGILAYNPQLPPCVVDIIDKALAKTPAGRYQTGNDMAKALKACAAAMGEAATHE